MSKDPFKAGAAVADAAAVPHETADDLRVEFPDDTPPGFEPSDYLSTMDWAPWMTRWLRTPSHRPPKRRWWPLSQTRSG